MTVKPPHLSPLVMEIRETEKGDIVEIWTMSTKPRQSLKIWKFHQRNKYVFKALKARENHYSKEEYTKSSQRK
jgi:hypothetical protein